MSSFWDRPTNPVPTVLTPKVIQDAIKRLQEDARDNIGYERREDPIVVSPAVYRNIADHAAKHIADHAAKHNMTMLEAYFDLLSVGINQQI